MFVQPKGEIAHRRVETASSQILGGRSRRSSCSIPHSPGATGSASPDGLSYFTVSRKQTWLTSGASAVSFIDGTGAAVWTKEADGKTLHQLVRDLPGRMRGTKMLAAGKSVVETTTYDMRGRPVLQQDGIRCTAPV